MHILVYSVSFTLIMSRLNTELILRILYHLHGVDIEVTPSSAVC